MKLMPGALGALLLLALLTWLLLRGIDTNAPAYEVTLRTFDDFALAEASLHRDVLQARAGLLRDYDTLVKAVETMQDAVNRLRSHAQTEGLDVGPADRLAAAVAQQEELTERFKSNNALLQNSLSYVGLLSTSPAFGAQDAQLATAAGALAAAVLYLTRDTSPDAVKALQERIDQFAAQAPAAEPAAARRGPDIVRWPPVGCRNDRAGLSAAALCCLFAVAGHSRVSRAAAARPGPCAAAASRFRACRRRELDAPDQ